MNDFNVLDTIRNEIQAEHALISHRMTWLVTSQSFLMTAFAISGGVGNQLFPFLNFWIPLVGIMLSALAFLGIAAAIWVQGDLIATQTETIKSVREQLRDDPTAVARLDSYAKTTASGRKTGNNFHWLAILPPLLIPIIFFVVWIAAWRFHVPNGPVTPRALTQQENSIPVTIGEQTDARETSAPSVP